MFKHIKIRSYEIGLLFREREFKRLLEPGSYWLFDIGWLLPWRGRLKADIVSKRDPWLLHEKLDLIVRSGVLKDRAIVLDLKDYERALVWIDGRFSHVLPPGLYAYWTGLREVRTEVVDARNVRFEHPDLRVIARSASVERVLELATVEPHHQGVLFVDGQFVATLPPGRYAFWKNMAQVKFVQEDLREQMIDIAGQEIMTADKVTLRMNAVVTYRVADARQAVSTVDNAQQALYREAQLAVRAVVGARELDTFLVDRDAVARELEELLRQRVSEFGLEVVAVGVPEVCWLLWPETFTLLKKQRSQDANRVLVSENGMPLKQEGIDEGKVGILTKRKLVNNDLIRSAYMRLIRDQLKLPKEKWKPLKRLRKTSSTFLEKHLEYGRYAQFFLGQAPEGVANTHYVLPSQTNFDKAVTWLGQQYGLLPSKKRAKKR